MLVCTSEGSEFPNLTNKLALVYCQWHLRQLVLGFHKRQWTSYSSSFLKKILWNICDPIEKKDLKELRENKKLRELFNQPDLVSWVKTDRLRWWRRAERKDPERFPQIRNARIKGRLSRKEQAMVPQSQNKKMISLRHILVIQ